jgi:trimeric autotransporter adhesin
MSVIILTFKNLRLRVGAFMLLLLSAFTTLAQNANVGIGTLKPDSSALLDLTSTSKGLLIPRMTLAQRAGVKNPATGLMVYQIDFFTGFYFFDGEVWKGLYARNIDGAPINSDPFSSAPSTGSSGWSLGGNSGLNAEQNFLGTVDTTSLVFKVNNYRSGLIDFRFGNTFFGYRAGHRSLGYNSIAIGAYALHDANLGLNNIAIGYQSLLRSQTGSDNVAVGANSLYTNITGSQNVGVGTQAGLRSVGDGNVFIGYKAGMNEIGNNKLYIDNNFQNVALIYGDFDKARVGINTQNPGSALSVDSKTVNLSGLEFKQLNSDSPAEKSNLKVLSVDKQGRVILVRDSVGTSSTTAVSAPSYWTLKGSSIENNNAGDVILSNIRFKSLRTISPTIKSNGKILTVDDNGLIVLARDSISTSAPSYWGLNGSTLSNTNAGKVTLNGLIQLGNIKASNTAFRPNGKVLSVDDNGNVILVRDSVATGSTIPVSTSPWNINGDNIGNSNIGSVNINNSLILSKLNSDITVTTSAQKFLTVDKTGNVILANVPPSTAPISDWTLDGTNISNKNTGGVYINNGLWAKNGFRLQSGTLELNSAIENKSGLQFTQLKASNSAAKGYGKVLSVDDNGNVILVKDSVGVVGTPVVSSLWAISGTSIVNSNTGRVIINNGITLPFTSETITPISTQKFLTVDNTGNVILANVPPITAPISDWTLDGTNISNRNTGGVYINNGLWAKNGFRLQSGTLELNSAVENKSGLQFAQLKASNPAGKGYGKVLSVDDNGNVILVKDSVGVLSSSTPVVSSLWSASGTTIVNSNTGRVIINNGLTLPFTSESISPISTQKFLTVDNAGNVILGNVPNSTPSPWTISGNDIVNSNLGKANISNGLSVKSGINIESGNLITNGSLTNRSGIVLNQLKLSFPASRPSGKVLSVDDNGNVILVRDSVGVTGTVVNTPSSWTVSADNISNANTGTVSINALTLPKLSSNNTPTVTTQKVLSVDANGNVILVNTPTTNGGTTPTVELWKSDTGGAILNNNTKGVVISTSTDGVSGLQFAKLKSSSAAGDRYGKVLSVDDNGNVILVNDGVTTGGSNTGAGWAITDGRLQNSNNGKVVIGTGINSFPGDFQLYVKGGILTERVRVAVANSDRWADYVFENGYKLMPLRDVEKHIDYYHHLPNVPSADQMTKSGMDIMETSAKLLEKIEELTLYMIKANKQIEVLEAKVNNLEKTKK